MENIQILIGLAAVIFVGIMTYLALRSRRQKGIPEVLTDEIRRTLWERGETATNFRMMTIWEGFKHFGLAAMPNAAYRDNYFVEVTATDENGAEKQHLTHLTLAFEKDIIDKTWKFNYQ